MQISLRRYTVVFEPRHEISNNVVGATSNGSEARLSLHLSKCHIVENHMSRLNFVISAKLCLDFGCQLNMLLAIIAEMAADWSLITPYQSQPCRPSYMYDEQ